MVSIRGKQGKQALSSFSLRESGKRRQKLGRFIRTVALGLAVSCGGYMYRMSSNLSDGQAERRVSVNISSSTEIPDGHIGHARVTPRPRESRESPKREKPKELIYQIVDTSSWAKPSADYQYDTTDIWEDDNAALPKWMRDYFRWHKEQIAKHWYTPETTLSDSHSFLYVTCLKDYNKCGGTADRLLSLPFFVKVAAATKRILVFQWSKPALLEEFLLPPCGGIDWRVPKSKEQALQAIGEKAGTQDTIIEMAHQSKNKVLQIKFQSHDHGAVYYDAMRESNKEPSFADVFHLVWKVFFTPSLALSYKIELTLKQNNLIPGNYTAAHLRALYNVETRDPTTVREWSRNALHCALSIQNQSSGNAMPVYFASDSEHATRQAVTYGTAHGLSVYALRPTEELGGDPLHLDKAKDWKKRPASDFLDIFVDLYVMSLSKCVTYGMGGFGVFAAYMSDNPSCALQHMTATKQLQCSPPRALRKRRGIILNKPKRYEPDFGETDESSLFLDPMPLHEITIKTRPQAVTASKKIVLSKADIALTRKQTLFPDMAKAPMEKIWEDSTHLPKWAKDYFSWHQIQRSSITEKNWSSFRYLIVVCLRDSNKCGGTADRLRPIPFFVKVATETNRILLIKWEKPAPLESFLVPPAGGLDWRAPDWMEEHIRSSETRATSVKKLVEAANGDSKIVKSQVQAHDHGSSYYNSQEIALGRDITDAFRQDYRDYWYSLFTPVPEIATLVENELDRMDLVPGAFSFAHVRALYDVEDEGRDNALVKDWTENALNCLSNIRPGGPFFFSSDSAYAKEVAVQYGQSRQVSVVTRLDDAGKEPLHLDKVSDWETRHVSDFYSIFVDLYLMSMAKCYTFNMGGFGKWANHISGSDFTCSVRHWTAGVDRKSANKNGCKWADQPKVHRIRPRMREKGPLFLPPSHDASN